MGQELQVFKGHQDNISSVAFSRDGKNILTGSNDKTARLWNLQGKTLQIFKVDTVITSVVFSPDGKNIFTGSKDGTACLWDLNGKVLQLFKGHEQMITSLAISADGKQSYYRFLG